MKPISHLKSIITPLNESQEEEFWDRQLDLMVGPVKSVIILGSIIVWTIIIGIWSRSAANRDIWLIGLLFQTWLFVCFVALNSRGRLRYLTIYATPAIPATLAYIFVQYVIPNLASKDAMLQAQYFPFLLILCFYGFETLSLKLAMLSGVSISAIVLWVRFKTPALAASNMTPILLMTVTTNIIGIIMCIFVRYTARMQFKFTKVAEREREVSDSLILKVFPESIGKELRTKGSNLARNYQHVTVLIADIANFTRITTTMEPKQLVTILHELFHRFDRLADIHGVEKIKTIGDAYMAAAGCPTQTSDHAERVGHFALELQMLLRSFNKSFDTDFHIRIGINSGPIVGGVISGKRISFDIWGDTVNLASRLQSVADPDEIILSDSTAKILRKSFQISEFRLVDLKGLGSTPVSRLMSAKEKNPYLSGKSKAGSSVEASALAFLSQH